MVMRYELELRTGRACHQGINENVYNIIYI